MAAFTFFASLASILSLFGWAAEKFLNYAPELLGIVSFFIIGFVFLCAIFMFVTAFVSYEKIKELHSDYVLSHRITHHLRNSITALQDLEFLTLKKIDNAESINQFSDIAETNELKKIAIVKKLGAKVSGAVSEQIKNSFIANRLQGNVRVTVKLIIPTGNNQLEWQVETLVVDPFTWNNQDRSLEERENETHTIGENSDFSGILQGKEKYFVCNNLSSLSDDNYRNSSKDWRKRYNSTVVVPIKNRPDGQGNAVYYGFITADSLNPKNMELFRGKEDSSTLNILAHAADALAVWFIKNDSYTKMLSDSFTQRERILILNDAINMASKKGVKNVVHQ